MTAGYSRSFLEKYKLDEQLFKACYIPSEGDAAAFLLRKSHERFTRMLWGPITVCANRKDVRNLFKVVTVVFDMSFQWNIAFGVIPTTEESYTAVKGILSSNGALALLEVPLQLVIINASYIGLQMGSVWGYRGSEMNVGEFAHAIFYLTDNARIINEEAALIGLINETWPISGINIFIHNLCFAGVLFKRYSVTGQVDFGASLAMLSQVAHDATNVNKEPVGILESSRKLLLTLDSLRIISLPWQFAQRYC